MQEFPEAAFPMAPPREGSMAKKSGQIGFLELALFVGYTLVVEHSRPTFLDTLNKFGTTNYSDQYEAGDKVTHESQIGTLVGAELNSSHDPERVYSIVYFLILSQGNGPAVRIPICEGDRVYVAGYDRNNIRRIYSAETALRSPLKRELA